jgi:predicted lipoprotein with Yx(FWY)xxD motif
MTIPIRRLISGAWLTGSLLAAAVLVAACGSSTKAGGGNGTTSAASSPGGSSSTTSAGAGTGVTIETHSGPMGTFLTDSSGKALYMFASDTSTKSSCSAACLTYWPPLTTTGAATATGGATSSMLGTISGSNGTKQVTYSGHPLYYFKLDTAAGDTKGQGSDNFGAKWWLLAPSGQPITAAAGASSPAESSSSSSGGGGGWS